MTTWIKVYNSMPSHPKFVMVGPQAGWLFVCGLCYSNEHLTNGFIPSSSLHVVAPGLRSCRQLAAKLVRANLWEKCDGGWRVHDYDKHQRSAEIIREQREKDAKRKAAVRADISRSPNGHLSESARSPQGVRDVEKSRVEKSREDNNTNTALRAFVVEVFKYWQERCNHPTAKLTPKREARIKARLREGYTVREILKGIDGAARGAFVNEKGHRFDDIELICRSGEKLEDFIRRADAVANVVPLRQAKESASDIWVAIDQAKAQREGEAS